MMLTPAGTVTFPLDDCSSWTFRASGLMEYAYLGHDASFTFRLNHSHSHSHVHAVTRCGGHFSRQGDATVLLDYLHGIFRVLRC